jgi:hypothetical protein
VSALALGTQRVAPIENTLGEEEEEEEEMDMEVETEDYLLMVAEEDGTEDNEELVRTLGTLSLSPFSSIYTRIRGAGLTNSRREERGLCASHRPAPINSQPEATLVISWMLVGSSEA